MNKAFKVLFILIGVCVGLVLLSFVLHFIFDVLIFIKQNYTLIIGVVAVISGLIFVMSDRKDNSSIRNIAGIILFFSAINLVGIYVGNLIDKGVESLFK